MIPKYNSSKMSYDVIRNVTTLSEQTIDTLIRYKERGSYAGRKSNNVETVLQTILNADITYDSGCDLPLLAENEQTLKRTMDFMIPSKENPRLIIESSFNTTTSSGNGDKAKTENGVHSLHKNTIPMLSLLVLLMEWDGIAELKMLNVCVKDLMMFLHFIMMN